MEELYTSQELERKNKLLGGTRLKANAQMVLRCAECILARPAASNDQPYLTGTEIERCTGLSQDIVRLSLQRVINQGSLEKKQAPSTFPSGFRKPVLYYLKRPGDDMEPFFVPEVRANCDRTANMSTLETFTQTERNVLTHVGRMVQQDGDEPMSVTISELRESIDSSWNIVQQVFGTFQRTGILTEVDRQRNEHSRPRAIFELTPYGKGLASDLEGLEFRDRKPKKRKQTELHPMTLQSIESHYPPEQQEQMANRLKWLVDSSILSQNSDDEPSKNGAALWFDSRAAMVLGKNGCIAVAHWLNLEPLVHGQRRLAKDVRYMLGLTGDQNLAQYTREYYFDPLLAKLETYSSETE